MTKKVVNIPQHAEVASTPATPDTGFSKIYMKTDKEWYWLDDTGTEVPFRSPLDYPLAVFVDPINGNNATAQKYVFNKPYQTYAAAYSAAVSGDLIVLRPGNYPGGYFQLKTGVNVYCEPGAILSGGFYDFGIPVTVKIFGKATFSTSGQNALYINGNGSNIYFEFDRIDGSRPHGILDDHNGTTTLTVVGNMIRCNLPVRIKNGVKNVNIKISELISGSSGFTFRLGSSSLVPLVGRYYIECPIIENTSSSFARSCFYFDKWLSNEVMPGQNHKIIVNADKIRTTNLTMTETYPNIISSCVWIDGGTDIEFNADLEGNACLGICNRGNTGSTLSGTFVFNGNISSNIECVSSGIKFATGNGWHNLIFKNGLIQSKGLGTSASVISFESYLVIHGGNAGTTYFNNCILYNELNGGNILYNTQNSPNLNNAFFYNCLAYIEGATGFFANSTEPSKIIGFHNTRSNVDNNIMITDQFVPSGFIYDTNLEIPKK